MNALKWLKALFAGWRNGPQATLPNSSSQSRASLTPEPSITPLEKLVQIAEAEIGKKETKGRNLGPDVERYQAATNLDPGAWPWCAAFVCHCLREWLNDPANRAWLALKKSTPTGWMPKTALAYGFLKWAKARPATTTILPDTATPEAGDIVVYDFSHIGIVKRCIGDKFEAIEGNTNSAGSRDGDGVYFKVRPRSLARAFIRIHPSNAY